MTSRSVSDYRASRPVRFAEWTGCRLERLGYWVLAEMLIPPAKAGELLRLSPSEIEQGVRGPAEAAADGGGCHNRRDRSTQGGYTDGNPSPTSLLADNIEDAINEADDEPAPGDGKRRLLTSVTNMAFQLMTGVNSTAPQVMTSVNRQNAGREVTSHPARFLLEFTPIYGPFTGVYSELPVFTRIFGAIWGLFDEIRTTFGRFLPENGRLLVPVFDLS